MHISVTNLVSGTISLDDYQSLYYAASGPLASSVAHNPASTCMNSAYRLKISRSSLVAGID